MQLRGLTSHYLLLMEVLFLISLHSPEPSQLSITPLTLQNCKAEHTAKTLFSSCLLTMQIPSSSPSPPPK